MQGTHAGHIPSRAYPRITTTDPEADPDPSFSSGVNESPAQAALNLEPRLVHNQQMVLGPAAAPTLLWWGGIPAGRAVRRGLSPSQVSSGWNEGDFPSIHPSFPSRVLCSNQVKTL